MFCATTLRPKNRQISCGAAKEFGLSVSQNTLDATRKAEPGNSAPSVTKRCSAARESKNKFGTVVFFGLPMAKNVGKVGSRPVVCFIWMLVDHCFDVVFGNVPRPVPAECDIHPH